MTSTPVGNTELWFLQSAEELFATSRDKHVIGHRFALRTTFVFVALICDQSQIGLAPITTEN